MSFLSFNLKCNGSIIISCLFFAVCYLGSSADFNDTSRLYRDLLAPFDRRVRPIFNQNNPIEVDVTVNVITIVSVDDVTQKIEVNAWLNISWVDQVRRWNPTDYGGVKLIHPEPLDIWRPRLLLSNSLEERDIFQDNYSPLSLNYDGVTLWYPAGIFRAYCVLNMEYFPFDEQKCSIIIIANDFGGDIKLSSHSERLNDPGFVSNGEWTLVSTTLSNENPPNQDNMSTASVDLYLKRRPKIYLINTLIPLISISFLSTVTFILPEESGERASFSITVLLGLSVFLSTVSGGLPKNSDTLPIIVIYIFSLLSLSGLCVLVNVCHLRMSQNKGRHPRNVASASKQVARVSKQNGDSGAQSYEVNSIGRWMSNSDIRTYLFSLVAWCTISGYFFLKVLRLI